ncbi:hypothetical protein RIF29_18870 [Crotalaria pallida]|uniref:Uncharacterized protein n=1 Tax=Crotalaria pallida TaxID=3830 RepID=A0AAN9I3M2_CROPI
MQEKTPTVVNPRRPAPNVLPQSSPSRTPTSHCSRCCPIRSSQCGRSSLVVPTPSCALRTWRGRGEGHDKGDASVGRGDRKGRKKKKKKMNTETRKGNAASPICDVYFDDVLLTHGVSLKWKDPGLGEKKIAQEKKREEMVRFGVGWRSLFLTWLWRRKWS